MTTVGIVQARMGSSRLPGKMMYPLDCRPVVEHVLRRVRLAESLDEVVVAIPDRSTDDVLADTVRSLGVPLHRGDEHDVLGRFHDAVTDIDAARVVRICGDTPLVSPAVIDAVVERLRTGEADYVYTMEPRTFPYGLDVEAFTARSFERVAERATESHQREHVTIYYREHASDFHLATVTATDAFDDEALIDRSDLRFTLDVAADYELFRRLYGELDFEGTVPLRDAVLHVDRNGLAAINDHVEQRAATDSERP